MLKYVLDTDDVRCTAVVSGINILVGNLTENKSFVVMFKIYL